MAVDVISWKSTSVIPFYVRLFASERYLFISSKYFIDHWNTEKNKDEIIETLQFQA